MMASSLAFTCQFSPASHFRLQRIFVPIPALSTYAEATVDAYQELRPRVSHYRRILPGIARCSGVRIRADHRENQKCKEQVDFRLRKSRLMLSKTSVSADRQRQSRPAHRPLT